MTEGIDFLGLALAVCLGLVHIFASRWQWLNRIPQRLWISVAGGVSIAYIFLDIFPELGEAQEDIESGIGPVLEYLEKHVYLLALAGLAIFYGLEKLAMRSRARQQAIQGEDCTDAGVFWIHILSFALYSAILGYLFHESGGHGLVACLLLFVVLALHFLVNDVNLREHHKRAYDRIGRWILAGVIILGWLLGQVLPIEAATIAAIWALVAGGIILNVLNKELPEEQESHFGLFVLGASIYAILLLAV